MQVEDQTESHAVWAMSGPASRAILERVCDIECAPYMSKPVRCGLPD